MLPEAMFAPAIFISREDAGGKMPGTNFFQRFLIKKIIFISYFLFLTFAFELYAWTPIKLSLTSSVCLLKAPIVTCDGKVVAKIYTDADGKYKTEPLSPGTYELQAWKQAFSPIKQKISLEDKPIKLDFEMIPKNITVK